MALTGVLEILSDDFVNGLKEYFPKKTKRFFAHNTENLTNYKSQHLHPLDALKIAASGDTFEKEI
jgi:hypothetical protein